MAGGGEQAWYVCQGGRKVGPMTETELAWLASTAHIAGDDFIWRTGLPDWIAAHSIPGLLPPQAPAGSHAPHPSAAASRAPDPSVPAFATGSPAPSRVPRLSELYRDRLAGGDRPLLVEVPAAPPPRAARTAAPALPDAAGRTRPRADEPDLTRALAAALAAPREVAVRHGADAGPLPQPDAAPGRVWRLDAPLTLTTVDAGTLAPPQPRSLPPALPPRGEAPRDGNGGSTRVVRRTIASALSYMANRLEVRTVAELTSNDTLRALAHGVYDALPMSARMVVAGTIGRKPFEDALFEALVLLRWQIHQRLPEDQWRAMPVDLFLQQTIVESEWPDQVAGRMRSLVGGFTGQVGSVVATTTETIRSYMPALPRGLGRGGVAAAGGVLAASAVAALPAPTIEGALSAGWE